MAWEVYLAQTMTGLIGPRLSVADSGSWTDGPLNDATSGEFTVETQFLLRKLERWQWRPWSASALVCWVDYDRRLWPVAAGPILQPPSGDRDTVTLKFGGFWTLMDDRIATDRFYRTDELVPRTPSEETPDGEPAEPLADTSKVAESAQIHSNLSLGTIGWELVKYAQMRPQGWLPVVHGSPYEVGTRQRTYDGFNLSNNSVGKRLRELTAVINGPDIAFRPRWKQGAYGNQFEWVMVHGTEAVPTIAQSSHFTLDLTAPRQSAILGAVSSEENLLSRMWATGAGEDQGTLIRAYDAPLHDRVPYREQVWSDSSVTNPDILQREAQARLDQGNIVQASVRVPASEVSFPINQWYTGDEAEVIFPDGFAQIPGGSHRMRIISRKGNFSSDIVDVEFQPEEITW